jgi:hypothetical protein
MIPGADKMKDKYQHLDQSKVEDAGELGLNMEDVDPAGSAVLAKGITEVQETGEGTYAGKLDAQGRLTELVVSVPAAGDTKAHDITVTYADYGNATTPQKPPADKVVEAPA